jgi:hypothetical protein
MFVLSKKNYYSFFCQFVFFGILIFGSNGPNIFSWFSIIDDHQLVLLLDEGVLNTDRVWAYILSIKDYYIGETGRFRPLFFPIVIFELYLFGDNIWMYYFSRLLGFTCLTMALYSFASIYLKKYLSLLVPILFISSATYSDFLGRIISSESLAIWFLVFFLYSTNYFLRMIDKKVYAQNLTFYFHLTSYFLSGFFLINIKENFAVIALLSLLISIQFFRKQSATLVSRLWIIVMVTHCFTASTVLVIISSYFMSASESLNGYGIGLISSYEYIFLFLDFVFFIVFVPLGFAIYLFFKNNIIFYKALTKESILVLLAILLAIFSQIVFYGVNFDDPSRYGFVTNLLKLVLVTLTASWMYKFVSPGRVVNSFIIIFLVQSMSGWNLPKTLINNYNSAHSHMSNTLTFKNALLDTQLKLDDSGLNNLVVVSNSVWDYELISSWYKFLKATKPSLNIYLKLNYYCFELKEPVQKLLCERLNYVANSNTSIPKWYSNNSEFYYFEWGYSNDWPILYDKCVELVIGDTASNSCGKINYFNYTGR